MSLITGRIKHRDKVNTFVVSIATNDRPNSGIQIRGQFHTKEQILENVVKR